MKKYFLFCFLVAAITGVSQNGDTAKKGFRQRQLISGPSTVDKLEQIKDSPVTVLPAPDETTIRENVSRNMEGILQLQKEQKAKQKKAAMIRIGIGVALLALLVYGLQRRKK